MTDGSARKDFFVADRLPEQRLRALWVTGSDNSPFNRVRLAGMLGVRNVLGAPNILAFISSDLGKGYFSHVDPIGVYALEPDFYGGRTSMSGVGRYLLFEVLDPRPPIRLRLSFTETLRGDGENRLPRVAAIGARRSFFPVTGRGSAAVVTEPITPRIIAGHAYILLDLGLKPIRFAYRRSGLMQLWGADIPIDPRYLSGFLRDLSVVSGNVVYPARLARFPDDLLDPSAEYSGIYEDGWASEDMSTTLRVGPSGQVELVGQVPLIHDAGFWTNVTVLVDGFPAVSKRLTVGAARVTVMTGSGTHTIEWRFSRFQRLPGGDHRPVTVLIDSIG